MATKKSIITDDLETCFICGSMATDLHHCIHGTANRKLADKYKLTVGLCRYCHMKLHDQGAGDDFCKMAAQYAFEEKVGDRLEFINIFGKSFL